MKKEKQSQAAEVLDISGTSPGLIPVVVGGNTLPLEIGRKVNVGDGLIRTVMKVQVNEDGNAMYGVQWVDGIEFRLEWMTYAELCYMSSCLKDKPKISL